eukprot:scaffold24265_cov117-Cylindrotheca_fusiformis.AAC.1
MTETDHAGASIAKKNRERQVWIGGPGSKLPFILESFLAWVFAISCLGVALYHYARQILFGTSTNFLPLTTHSRREILSKTTVQRYHQLTKLLERIDKGKNSVTEWTDDELIKLVRSNTLVRRLVSLVMVKIHHKATTTEEMELDLVSSLTRIWPRLVELPKEENRSYAYDISIFVPAYREDGKDLQTKLQEAHDMANQSLTMELIVVHGHCTNMDDWINNSSKKNETDFVKFAKVTCVPDEGGGRGPCLNQGAAMAQGRILTFLHADTRLSKDWNLAIGQAFSTSTDNKNNEKTVLACAFSFAIDTSSSCLQSSSSSSSCYFPPGIRAIERTANWRSHWFDLPYGDQCLSVPEYVFNYVGGYPHQCLMEDYELIRLLRQRRVSPFSSSNNRREVLTILDLPAHCHVRRWQRFGVLYVTYFNSKLVNLYSQEKMTAEELFRLYYGTDQQQQLQQQQQTIPWEVELERLLHK